MRIEWGVNLKLGVIWDRLTFHSLSSFPFQPSYWNIWLWLRVGALEAVSPGNLSVDMRELLENIWIWLRVEALVAVSPGNLSVDMRELLENIGIWLRVEALVAVSPGNLFADIGETSLITSESMGKWWNPVS